MHMAFEENLPSDERQPEAYWAVVADLVSLIQRTRTLERVHELMKPAGDDEQPAGDVFVLDDVTPRQPLPVTAISDCNLRLREALHFLLEARASQKQRQIAVASTSL